MNLWPNQIRARDLTAEAVAGGCKRMCVTSPTGTGKTYMQLEQLELANSHAIGAALYTDRRMLLEQTEKRLKEHGFDFGMRAAGHEPALTRPIQLCMTQTELSQVYDRKQRPLHWGKRALVDEIHKQKGDGMMRIIGDTVNAGGCAICYTATPLDLSGVCDELIVAGNVSEGRACGALVGAYTMAPDEPDPYEIKNYRIGEDLSDADNHAAMMRPGIFGRVFEHWEKLNPDRKPTILFGPDVAGSLFFAEQFQSRGIRAAHIDGDKVWLDGEFHSTDQVMRDELSKESENGNLPIVCNRFVLREGIDWPWLEHGILACVFGSLTTYLQAGGRLLRSHPGKDRAVIQDHGGSWWRHGSLNSDREWSLGDTNRQIVSDRIERMRSKTDPEPIHCPQCNMIRLSGNKCPKCGYMSGRKSRIVLQSNGTLTEKFGDIIRPRVVATEPTTMKKWEGIFWRMRKSRGTFKQAEGLFRKEYDYWPPRNLPLMPLYEEDWSRHVRDVPFSRLRAKPPKKPDPQEELFR